MKQKIRAEIPERKLGNQTILLSCCLVFTFVALYGLFLKHVILSHISGYLAMSRVLGRVDAKDFTWIESLSLYREDLLVILSGTTIFYLVMRRIGVRYVCLASGLATVSFWLFLFFSHTAFSNVGTFLTPQLAKDSLLWAIDHPSDVSGYITPSGFVRLIGVAFFVCGSFFVIYTSHSKLLSTLAPRVFIGLILLLAFLAGLGFSITMPLNTSYRSALFMATKHMLSGWDQAGLYAKLDTDEIVQRFSVVSLDAQDQTQPEPKAAHYKNLILIILETAPQEALNMNSSFFRDVHQILGPDSVIMSHRHYTTYPYTSDATLSIFSSLYSEPRLRKNILRPGGQMVIGWPDILHKNGYATKAYAPSADTFEDDATLHRRVGFSDRFIAERLADTNNASISRQVAHKLSKYPGLDSASKDRFTTALYRDRVAFEALKQDIQKFYKENRRFLVSYSPQIGHGPWFKLVGDVPISNARELVELQLEWVIELLRDLNNSNDMSNTLVVITGDHGPRTASEYPDLPGGKLIDVTVNVPLIFLSNGVAKKIPAITEPTSHIDFGPTFLDLLGFKDLRPIVQGKSMWYPGLSERRLFLFGGDYLGANGFIEKERFISCNSFNKICDLSTTESNNYLVNNTQALTLLHEMRDIQSRISTLVSK